MTKPPKYLCFHEAGHCVARWYTGYSVVRAVVRPGRRVAGSFRGTLAPAHIPAQGSVQGDEFELIPLPASAICRPEHRAWDWAIRAHARRRLVICYAGMVAQARACKQSYGALALNGSGNDMEQAQELLAAHFPGERDVARKEAWSNTKALVWSDKGWRAIMAIAGMLQERGSLTDKKVHEACSETFGFARPTLDCILPPPAYIRAGMPPTTPPR